MTTTPNTAKVAPHVAATADLYRTDPALVEAIAEASAEEERRIAELAEKAKRDRARRIRVAEAVTKAGR
jgi:hypothetical protein